MAIAQALPVAQGTSGLFGLASVGVGLRVGLQAIQGNEEAAARIAEAREAAAEAARERLAMDAAWRTLPANLMWFGREQRKLLAFDEGVFIFMLSAALVFDQLIPMLWVFAASQVVWGLCKCWIRGRHIEQNRKISVQK